MKYYGVFLGRGGAINIGLGFVPHRVALRNVESANMERIEWEEGMTCNTTCPEGFLAVAGTWTALTAGQGVVRYYGGDVISTAATTHVIPVHMVGVDTIYAGDMRAKSGTLIDTWTLDTSANRTGHWNTECNTTFVGSHSRIWIKAYGSSFTKQVRIQALTSNGEQADEVTLSEAIGSGVIERISYLYDFFNAPAGFSMPAGITINETANLNVSGETVEIFAE